MALRELAEGGWLVINMTKGQFDGYYHREKDAVGMAEFLQERWPDDGIVVARAKYRSEHNSGVAETGHPRHFTYRGGVGYEDA